MSVRLEIPFYEGIYFITFTNARWLPLFQMTDGYDLVYKWFNYLKAKGHFIIGYVTMPNHLHALLAFRNTQGQSINSIIGNGKRFMSYEIITRLEDQKNDIVLEQLASFVKTSARRKGKLHEVFESSFDWKDCVNRKFIEQKLDYIHNNPCSGKWRLVTEPWEYLHSSARFYHTGEQEIYEVTSYDMLEDIDLSKPLSN